MKLSGNGSETITQNLIKLWNSLLRDVLGVCIDRVVSMEKRSILCGVIQPRDLILCMSVFACHTLSCLRRKAQAHRQPLASVHPGTMLFNLSLIASFHLHIGRGGCGQEGCSLFLPKGHLKSSPCPEQP